jgi:hypothetical protein
MRLDFFMRITKTLPSEDYVLALAASSIRRARQASKPFWLFSFFQQSFPHCNQAALVARFAHVVTQQQLA